MAARQSLHTFLTAQRTALASNHPLKSMAINLDQAASLDPSVSAHFGITLGNKEATPGLRSDNTARDFDGQFEIIIYAHTKGANKYDRSAEYAQVEALKGWLLQVTQNDPSFGGAFCPHAQFGAFRQPVRGDALESQPYVLEISTLTYEEQA